MKEQSDGRGTSNSKWVLNFNLYPVHVTKEKRCLDMRILDFWILAPGSGSQAFWSKDLYTLKSSV